MPEVADVFYDHTTLEAFFKRDGQLVQETIKIVHRPIDLALFDELKAIEADKENSVPVITRQLVLLDAQSPDLTEKGERPQFTAEFWTKWGEPFQQRVLDAITPNAARAAVQAMRRDGDGTSADTPHGEAESTQDAS